VLLPNADRAIISESKTRGYLFNPDHPDNGGKWRLFQALGYGQENWREFADDVKEQHLILDSTEVGRNDFARLFLIEGDLQGPIGSARIRTTWAIPFGTDVPVLTSAYRVRRPR
jgi:uncharacterized protein DUF6883